MKKQHIVAAALGALMLMPAIAQAEETAAGAMTAAAAPGSAGTANLSASDKDFITKAAQGGMIEIQTAKLAKKTSSNDSIKAFSQTMIDDHKKADDKLKKIAKKLNVNVPRELDTEHQGQLDQLKSATASDFDQKFITIQDKDHNDAVTAFQKEADNGDNLQLKDFAAKTLPTLQNHMQMVKQLQAKVPPAAMSGTK